MKGFLLKSYFIVYRVCKLSCGLPPEAGDEADDDEEEIPVEMSVSVSQTTDLLSSKIINKMAKSDSCQFCVSAWFTGGGDRGKISCQERGTEVDSTEVTVRRLQVLPLQRGPSGGPHFHH